MGASKLDSNLIYLDTYILQQDMRIRMPKSILTNLGVEKGKSKFNIYFDKPNQRIVLEVNTDDYMENKNEESK